MKNITKTKIVGVLILPLLLTSVAYGVVVESDSEGFIQAEEVTALEATDSDDISDDDDLVDPAQDYNSTRSNRRKNEMGDIDDDGDGIDTIDEVKVNVKSESNMFMEFEDVEGERATEVEAPEGDYNSSRSNKPTEIGSDPDDDGDVVDTINVDIVNTPPQNRNQVQLENRRGEAIIIDRSGESSTDLDDIDAVCGQSRGAALDEEGKVYCWGGGFSIKSSSGTGGGAGRVSIGDFDFKSIRNWPEEDKESLREFGRNVAEERKEGRMARMVIENMDDERVQSIEIDEAGGRVRYMARMRLLGFIPLEREVEARIENGVEKVDYPWYGFLSRKPDGSKISSILSDLQNLI